MERSPAVWAVAVFFVLVAALPHAFAVCAESTIPLSQYNRFELAIHDSNGAVDFNSLRSLFPAKVSRLDVNSTVLASPSLKDYYMDEFNGYAADANSLDLFVSRSSTVGAPFLISGVVSSNLRIARDLPNGPGYGAMLHERYDGRVETSIWRSSSSARTALSAVGETLAVLTGLKNRLLRSPRIVNVLRAGDFNVVIVCASSVCDQEVYSLFTKYLNIGTSAEMFAEFGGTAVWNKVLPSSFKRSVRSAAIKLKRTTPVSKIIDRWNSVARRVPGMPRIDTFSDQLFNDLAKQSDEVKDAYLQCVVYGRCSALENPEIIQRLTPEQRARFARAVVESSVVTEDLVKVLSDPAVSRYFREALDALTDNPEFTKNLLSQYASIAKELTPEQRAQLDSIIRDLPRGGPPVVNGGIFGEKSELVYGFLDRLSKDGGAYRISALEDFFSALKSRDNGALDLLAKQMEGAGDAYLAAALSAGDFLHFSEALSRMSPEQIHALVDLFAHAKSSAANLRRASTELQRYDPVDFGLAGATREWTQDILSDGAIKRILKEGILVPGLMYIVRSGGGLTRQQIPGGFVGFSNLGALAGPYPVPKEWKFTRITPTESPLGQDAFVDVLIGGGSDPGDFFKTLLSSTFPWAVLENTVFHGHQPSILSAFVVGNQQERMYSMGPSLVSLAVAAQSCPTCSISSVGGGHFVFAARGAEITGSVVEAERDSIGTTSIVFAHHSNIDFGDASVDIAKAAVSGESCDSKCAVVKTLRKFSGKIFGDPSRAAFVATLLESMMYTAFGPGFIVFDIPIQMKLYGGCHDCVDTWGGYYIHSFVPHVSSEQTTSILASSPSRSVQDIIRRLVPVASLGGFEKELNKFATKLKASELEKGAPYVDFYLRDFDTGELQFTKVVSIVMGRGESNPSVYSTKGSLVLGNGKHTMVINTRNGTVSVDGNVVISSPDHVRMYSVDPEIPGIVIPAVLVVTEFNTSPAFVAHSSKEYSFEDNAFVNCVKSHFVDLNKGLIDLKDAMGDLVSIRTSEGDVSFGKDSATASTRDWAGRVGSVSVDGIDRSYAVESDSVDFGVDGNQFTLKPEHKVLGTLDGIVFTNGVIVRKGNYLLLWRKWLARIPAQAVARVELTPDVNKGTITPQFVPKPSADPVSKASVSRLDEMLKQIGGVSTIDAQRGYIQFFDKNGQLWVRYYDKDANRMVVAPVTDMHRDPNDPSTIVVDTPNGSFRVSLPTGPNGEVHLKVDGKDLGLVMRMQGPKGALIYDPNNGTWSLLNGLIAGLSKAFSNGIKISFNGSGFASMAPANYSNIYRNISALKKEGLSLPLLDGWELMVLLIAVAALYAVTL